MKADISGNFIFFAAAEKIIFNRGGILPRSTPLQYVKGIRPFAEIEPGAA
jgi:hypothetical protein